MREKKPPVVLPNYGYKVQNTENSRTIVLGTTKKILSLPEQKDVFLDLQIRFHHLDIFTTNVIADMTLVKGPDEGEVRKKKHKQSIPTKQQKKEVPPLAPLKTVLRALPSGEYYAVHNWVAPAPRVQLVVEEPAIREVGPDRDDETSKDILSFETGCTSSTSEKTLQEPIYDFKEFMVSGNPKKFSCETVEQPKEVQKKSPVRSIEKPTEPVVESKKRETIPVQIAVKPKEVMETKEVPKEPVVLAQQTKEGPKKAAVLAACSVETKPGAKKGQTDLLLAVRTTKE